MTSIYGAGGTDTLDGGDGNDTLDGYNSTSQLVGGAGNDLFYVDGGDTVVEGADVGDATPSRVASATRLRPMSRTSHS